MNKLYEKKQDFLLSNIIRFFFFIFYFKENNSELLLSVTFWESEKKYNIEVNIFHFEVKKSNRSWNNLNIKNFWDTILFLGQIHYEEFKKHSPETTGPTLKVPRP